METKNIELITKMVIDAINQSESKSGGFMVPSAFPQDIFT